MSPTKAIVNIVDQETVSNTTYDVVIVGAGIAGAIVAKQLSEQGKTVLILEAGTGEGLTLEGFQSYVDNFYGAVAKHGNAPYPANANAASPTDNVAYPYRYFVEKGNENPNDNLLPLSGSYTRVLGGTTMHWEGKTLRMIPEDFNLDSLYGHGLDWPINFEDVQPYYRKAEYEIGVSGNTDEQKAMGIPFESGYVLPMKELPPSYLDEKVREHVDGTTFEIAGDSRPLKLSTFPQGRNSMPNPEYRNYNGGYDFVPKGVSGIDPVEYGERCQGNANCVSICPVQAKYDARRTLTTIAFPERVHLLPKAVAYKVETDSQTGRVTAIHYKRYVDKDSPKHTDCIAKGRLFVLAANAIENAKLMLMSDLPSTSGMMGQHLMDHPFLLAWGLMPEVTGSMRGPLVTSGIGSFRTGDLNKGTLRQTQCAFGMDIHNDGWGWSGTGYSDVVRDAIDNQKKYGSELRQELISKISRQILLAFMCELPALPENKITIDPKYTDQLGINQPVITFTIPDYCKKTMADARRLSAHIFNLVGVEDHTDYGPRNGKYDEAYFEYEGEGYWFRGGNHFSGTHIMGTTKNNSVVDAQLRSWDHENLYLLGSGSMPTIGTSNTSLTIAALSFRASEQMLQDLNA